MDGDRLVLSMLDRILEKQDQTMSTLSDHTHLLAKVKDVQEHAEDIHEDILTRLGKIEKEHAAKTCTVTASVEKQKAWIPVVLKLVEILALVVGVLLGIKTVL